VRVVYQKIATARCKTAALLIYYAASKIIIVDMNWIGTGFKRLLRLVTHNWALKLLALALALLVYWTLKSDNGRFNGRMPDVDERHLFQS
jgi:hypothetical protein